MPSSRLTPFPNSPAATPGAAGFRRGARGAVREVGLQPRLRDVGIPQDALRMLAEDAMKQTRLLVNNPRPLALADARAIYEAAW